MKKLFNLFFIVIMLAFCSVEQVKAEVVDTPKSETQQESVGTIPMTKADFLAKIYNYEKDPKGWKYVGGKPAIIDFYATWCGPCRRISPVLEELAKEYKDKIVIYKVDTDKEPELAGALNIRSIPTLIFVPMEGQPQVAQGALPKENLKQIIDSVLLKK